MSLDGLYIHLELQTFLLLSAFLASISVFVILLKNKQIRQNNKRLKVVKELVDNIHKNFDLENIKEISVQKIGQLLAADRCFIVEYNEITEKFSIVNSEYLSTSEKFSLKGELPPVQATRVTDICIRNKNLNIPNTIQYIKENNLQDTLIEAFYLKYNIKAVLGVPIRHSGKVLAAIVLHYSSEFRSFPEEDMRFVHNIADSIGIALYQSQLYKEQQKTARKDSVLRHITETIRITLDMNETKQLIVNEIGQIFKADRCYLRGYDQVEGAFLKPDVEYLGSPSIKSLKDVEPNQKGLSYFFDNVKLQRGVVPVEVTQHSFEEEKIKNPALADYFEQAGIKTDFALPVWDKKGQLTFLVLHYKEDTDLSPEDKELLIAISKQVSIALEQANLYNETKIQAEREKIARKIIEEIKSTAKLDKILKVVSSELMGYLKNVDRLFIGRTEFVKEKDYMEVVKNPSIKKVTELSEDKAQKLINYWVERISHEKKFKIVPNMTESDLPSEIKDLYFGIEVKSIAVFPIILNEEMWGGLFLSSTEKYKRWDEGEIVFLENIVAQIAVAIKQGDLYNNQKKTAQRERLLRRVIETIRSSIDINKTLETICREIAQVFHVQRVTIMESPDKNDYSKFITRKEYKTRDDIKGLKDINYEPRVGAYNGTTVLHEGKKLVINDINESDTPDFYKKTYNELGVKSILSVPVQSDENKFGVIFLSSVDSFRDWTTEEVNLLESIAAQVYVAIYQAGLFDDLKEKVKRETLLRKISEVSKQFSDIDVVKHKIVNLIGKAFDADRCYIRYADKIKRTQSKAEVEYRKNPNLVSVMDVEPNKEGIQFFLDKNAEYNNFFYIKDLDKYLEENNLQNSPLADYLNELDTKSDYPFVAWEDDKQLINIVLHYTGKPHYLSQEEMDYIGSLMTQAGYVINQAKMYNEQKETAQREKTLRELTEMIRQSLDLNQIIHTSIATVGKMFGARRVFYSRYDEVKGVFLTPVEAEEYLASDEIPSFSRFGKILDDVFPFVCSKLKETLAPLIISDIYTFIKESSCEEAFEAFLIKNASSVLPGSSIILPLLNKDVLLGGLVFEFHKANGFDEDTVVFLQTLSEQMAIAIIQAKLFDNQKQNARREKTLRELTNMIRESSDIREIIETFVWETGKMFDFQRAFFVKYDKDKNIILAPEDYAEYSSDSEKRLYSKALRADFSNVYSFFVHTFISTKKTVFFVDREKFIEEYNLENTLDAKALREDDIGTVLAIPIIYEDTLLGVFACSHKDSYKITREMVTYLESVSEQMSIALYQAELLEKEKQLLEKERILRSTITTMRKTLDIKKIKNYLVKAIAGYLDADSVLLIEYNSYKNKFMPVDNSSEFLKTPEMKSFVGYDWNSAKIKDYTDTMKQKNDLVVSDVADYLSQNNLQGGAIEDLFVRQFGAKSVLSIPITHNNGFIGFFCINFVTKKYNITPSVEYFLRILVDQAGIALHQSKLYEFQRKTAYNEKVLKDIISEIKLTRDLNHAYNTLLKKLSEIFNLNRTLFLESSPIDIEQVNIKYEYVINRTDMAINNLVFPQVCIDEFLNLIHNLEPLVINDVRQCHPVHTHEFFQKYQIKALVAMPLVKYNGEAQVLGFIVLCAEEIKIWTEEELELIQIISDSVVSVIWEISKFIETEDLRNSFVLTLAHDFQVPLVGEKTALEYLLNYSSCATSCDKEILQELLENNQNISVLLDKFVDIYNYESGKKNLLVASLKIGQLLREAILVAKFDLKEYDIKVNLKEHSPDFSLILDRKEITKVFTILLENAISHSYENEEVTINYFKKQNRIIISIHNFGKAIPEEVQDRIFKRYEMALALERKIGAGTGLFLAKRIIEAHKGIIWFETSEEKGTTFFVSLPYNS